MILITGGAFQGKMKYALESFGDKYTIENKYHEKVKAQLMDGQDPLMEAEKLVADDVIVITDEIGCGLVPVDSFERKYRDVNGRVNCFLAENAEQVIRVICGIGKRIK